MVVRHIELETLSSSSFKDYGDVIDGASIGSGSLINNGYTCLLYTSDAADE